LLLKGELGKQTRLGSELLESWEEYVLYASLGGQGGVNGQAVHIGEHLITDSNWRIRHCRCDENIDVELLVIGSNSTCKRCFGLGDDKNFNFKVTEFVLEVHSAKHLFHLMYKSKENTEAFIAGLRSKANYTASRRSSYNKLFELSREELHRRVKSYFTARMRLPMVEAFSLFCATTVIPCIQVEPHHNIKESAAKTPCDYMLDDPDTTPAEANAVFHISTGQLRRQPGLHGTMVAISEKFRALDNGKATMKNRHRNLAVTLSMCFVSFLQNP
jgi:hypothetical protein